MKPSIAARTIGSHVVIQGEPKTGKSTLVSKLLLEPGIKLWWFSLDNGHEILWKLPLSREEMDERLELFIIPDTRDFPVALGTLRAVCRGRETFVCDSHGQAGCSTCTRAKAPMSRICLDEFTDNDILVIDHGGQLKNSVVAYISQDRSKNKEEAEIYKMTLPDWGTCAGILDGIFSNIQQSKANIILITHTVETEGEDGTKKLVPDLGSANFSRSATKYFGHVVYISVANKMHKVGSSSVYSMNAITGSRTDVAIETMKEPSLLPFFKKARIADKLDQHGGGGAKLVQQLEELKPRPATEIVPVPAKTVSSSMSKLQEIQAAARARQAEAAASKE